jgi:hypothetical protein
MTNKEKIEAYLDAGKTLTVVKCMQLGFGTELRKNVSDLNYFYEFMKSPYRIKGHRKIGSRCKIYKMERRHDGKKTH